MVVSEPIDIDAFPINVSASIGVTFYPQDKKIDAEEIIKQADWAMYQAKMSGKNCYYVFNPDNKLEMDY
jgi:diguanylate cyclase (GGDEF)-like protein